MQIDKFNGTVAVSNGGTEQMYRRLLRCIPQETQNKLQIVCSRVRELDATKKRILWLHDFWNDPESKNINDKGLHKHFDEIVFVSEFQRTTYLTAYGWPYAKTNVIRNGIEPFQNLKKRPSDTINLVYHTTPHRGLEILQPVFLEAYKLFPNIKLHVFSSFKIYGNEGADIRYKELFDICNTHPAIVNYGTVSNETIREKLQEMHIFAYPCIWPETSCIALIEALCAGLFPIVPEFTALTETIGFANANRKVRYNEDYKKYMNDFYIALITALEHFTKNPQDLDKVRAYNHGMYNQIYNFENIMKNKWQPLISSLTD